MHSEDHPIFMNLHLESQFNPNPFSEPAQTADESVFPAELLDSGFELTEFLTS
jgi:hypothetical protein